MRSAKVTLCAAIALGVTTLTPFTLLPGVVSQALASVTPYFDSQHDATRFVEDHPGPGARIDFESGSLSSNTFSASGLTFAVAPSSNGNLDFGSAQDFGRVLLSRGSSSGVDGFAITLPSPVTAIGFDVFTLQCVFTCQSVVRNVTIQLPSEAPVGFAIQGDAFVGVISTVPFSSLTVTMSNVPTTGALGIDNFLFDSPFQTISNGLTGDERLDVNVGRGGEAATVKIDPVGAQGLQDAMFELSHYVDVGADGAGFPLRLTTITQEPTKNGNTVTSQGTFQGQNGLITWTAVSTIPLVPVPLDVYLTTLTFSSPNEFGKLRLIQYADIDVTPFGGNKLIPLGTYGQPGFQLVTMQGSSAGNAGLRMFQPLIDNGDCVGPGTGWAAAPYDDLRAQIRGGGASYSPTGVKPNLNLTTDLRFPGMPAYGPADITSALACDLSPDAKSARLVFSVAYESVQAPTIHRYVPGGTGDPVGALPTPIVKAPVIGNSPAAVTGRSVTLDWGSSSATLLSLDNLTWYFYCLKGVHASCPDTLGPSYPLRTPLTRVTIDGVPEGAYTFYVQSSDGTIPGKGSNRASIPVNIGPQLPFAQLTNISTRGQVGTGNNLMIGGFIIQGSAPKRVLVRGRGPSLSGPPFSIPGALGNPLLRVFSGSTVIAQNDNWRDPAQCPGGFPCGTAAEIEASGLDPCQPNPNQSTPPFNCLLESAILITLPPGAYTAQLLDASGAVGVGLIEVFDIDKGTTSTLHNISTRGIVATGAQIMIAGVIIEGNGPKTLLLRGRGPSLSGAPFLIPGTLDNPSLSVFSGGTSIAQNNNWNDAPNCALGIACGTASDIAATGLDPCQPNPGQNAPPPLCNLESAILITLSPGAYTVQLSSATGQTGVGLVEIFEIPF